MLSMTWSKGEKGVRGEEGSILFVTLVDDGTTGSKSNLKLDSTTDEEPACGRTECLNIALAAAEDFRLGIESMPCLLALTKSFFDQKEYCVLVEKEHPEQGGPREMKSCCVPNLALWKIFRLAGD